MTTTIPPKKVFCGECQFYIPVEIRPVWEAGPQPSYIIEDKCSHLRSYRDSYYKKNAIRIRPSERNAENNCPDFKLKEEG